MAASAKILQFPKKVEDPPAEEIVEPRLSLVCRAIRGELYKPEPFVGHDRKEKLEAGTHRFDIHPWGAIYSEPKGLLINRAEDRKQRMARNAAAIALWEGRYVEVTDDGFVVREMN